ncbi:bridging integrator 3 [Anaeramoeba flamelloides]|uniref:Bridging integrator 3 n=1 Tax=Anaeramoeba flamelloides TaxID=1746091 RepID=A0ABQ8YJL9_9EUKA|nr:bridging integrator 3 [Anaeramoeba flamelloides]
MSKSQKAKRFWKRGQQKLLQKVGKAEQTVDKDFTEKVEQFQTLKANTNKINISFIHLVTNLTSVQRLTSKLDEDLNTFFEHHPAEEKEDKENVEKLSKALKSSSKLLEDDLEQINKHCSLKIESKVNSLIKLEKNIKERNRLLTEHDFHKRKLDNAKKKKEKNKIEVAEDQFHTAKKIYKKSNKECKEKITKYHSQKDYFLTKIHINFLEIYKSILESLNQKRTNIGIDRSVLEYNKPTKNKSKVNVEKNSTKKESTSSESKSESESVSVSVSGSESKSKSESESVSVSVSESEGEKSEKNKPMSSDNDFTETTLEPVENQEN